MSIHINIPSIKCRAGATVSGTVSLHEDVDIDVQTITISLIGRCKTKVVRSNGNSRTTYRGRAPLLEYRQVLFKGPNTMKTNGHSWPFSFHISYPLSCSRRRSIQTAPWPFCQQSSTESTSILRQRQPFLCLVKRVLRQIRTRSVSHR